MHQQRHWLRGDPPADDGDVGGKGTRRGRNGKQVDPKAKADPKKPGSKGCQDGAAVGNNRFAYGTEPAPARCFLSLE